MLFSLCFRTLGLRFPVKMDMDLMVSKNTSKYYLPVIVSRSLMGCGGIHLSFIRTILQEHRARKSPKIKDDST